MRLCFIIYALLSYYSAADFVGFSNRFIFEILTYFTYFVFLKYLNKLFIFKLNLFGFGF